MPLFKKKDDDEVGTSVEISTEQLSSDLSTSQAENKDLKAQLKAFEDSKEAGMRFALIDANRESLSLSTEDCTKLQSLSLDGIKDSLLAFAITKINNITASFDDTASIVAGAQTEDTDTNETENFADAISLIAKRDDITKMEASEKAKTEFPELFNKIYE